MSGSALPYGPQLPDLNILPLGDSAIQGLASSGRERGAGRVNGRGGAGGGVQRGPRPPES